MDTPERKRRMRDEFFPSVLSFTQRVHTSTLDASPRHHTPALSALHRLDEHPRAPRPVAALLIPAIVPTERRADDANTHDDAEDWAAR